MERSFKLLKPADPTPDVEVTVTVIDPLEQDQVAPYPVATENADVTTAFASLRQVRDSLPARKVAVQTANASNADIEPELEQPRGGWSEERRLW